MRGCQIVHRVAKRVEESEQVLETGNTHAMIGCARASDDWISFPAPRLRHTVVDNIIDKKAP